MAPPHTTCVEEHPHDIEDLYQRRFNAFVPDEASGVYQARADVVRFQPRVALQHDLRRVADGQHAEDMLDLLLGMKGTMSKC